ncbi:MAG: hypothetical protein QGI21_01175 [Candidatus Poseidoniaceae archaeon]|nr:hypothetical protein [Candidatus Poseidoniaceae archaeon]
MPGIVVYALGGNALSSPTRPSDEETALVLAKVMSDVVDLLESGWKVVLTHGNGPQVGHLMSLDNSQSMDSWVAATQGMIGHDLSINLDSILRKRGRPEKTAVLLTRVEIDSNDKGLEFPTKPVGPVLSDSDAMSLDWDIAETTSGPRRVVASPIPREIIDIEVIKALVGAGAIVICGGGGGIPILRLEDHFRGIPAVVDKDRFSALLAIELEAEALIISTAIDSLKLNFNTPSEQTLTSISLEDAYSNLESGQFPVGSMGPKVASLCDVVEKLPKTKAILCQPGDAIKALRGQAGTRIVS